MTIEFQDYAKDIKLNLSSVLKIDPESELKENQIFAIALSCAYATKNSEIVNDILDKAGDQISSEEKKILKKVTLLLWL